MNIQPGWLQRQFERVTAEVKSWPKWMQREAGLLKEKGMAINPLYNIDWLKKNHQMIHYFGLGFVQLKLDDKKRMHFYHPGLPKTVEDEDIHNHRYNFTSYILRGRLEQYIFRKVEGDTHYCQLESCQVDKECPNNKKEPCAIELVSSQEFVNGSNYWINYNTFHRVRASIKTVTVLKRGPYFKEYAEVIRHKSSVPVCPFSKNRPEAELWEVVKECLNG